MNTEIFNMKNVQLIPKEEPKQIKCYCGHTTYCDCSPLEKPKEEPTEEAKQRAKNYMRLKGALEPKQETLEEDLTFPLIIENGMDYLNLTTKIFNNGAKWMQERMYSEEDIENIWNEFVKELPPINNGASSDFLVYLKQFKKK